MIESDVESLSTIEAALDAGINFFDTAYSYGYEGKSDELLRTALRGKRSQAILASKVGMHWDADGNRVLDARPQTLIDHAQQVLKRLDVEFVDLMYLHTPDGNTPIEESAQAIRQIVDRGWARYAAVSNVDSDQARRFHAICPVIAVQPYFNMLQQSAVAELRTFCEQENVAIVCYWVLMKGLLAGQMLREHRFDPRDRRLTYDIFQGESWQRNQDFVDRLRRIADRNNCSVSQLVIGWTLAQPAISVALCGAKRPAQIRDNAGGMNLQLDHETLAELNACIEQRGQVS